MKLVHVKGLPTVWRKHPHGKAILAEADIRLTRGSRLAAKLLVFPTPQAMRTFWWRALGSGLGPRCLGAVNGLSAQGSGRLECDPRYFCIIGLVRGHLSMEVVCHEAIHAGFSYAKRAKRDIFGEAKRFDEEAVCYPAGRIAAAINRFLHSKGLYQ